MIGNLLIEIAQAGVITDAPPLTHYFFKVLTFGLSLVGVLGIMMAVLAGMRYFLAGGDKKEGYFAKRQINTVVVGILMALSAGILVKLVASFLR